MKESYHMTIAGCERDLPLCKAENGIVIGAFVIFGDVELTVACAKELLKLAPEYDYMVAPEAKAIPLIHEMARQSGKNQYFLIRKNAKFYMKGVFDVEVKSITTANVQHLYMDGEDAAKLKGKRVLLIDDVISTGESLAAVEALVNKAGGNIVGKLAILAEGKAADRDDIKFLEKLPLFDQEGNPVD
ncbi:MAG: phosphoribosyltransferase family protein [Bacillota bacterium]|nr:phosphoribosyltransferase family protein [Bacillota bacterium]